MTQDSSQDFSSLIPQVEFVDIQDQYDYNNELICKFVLHDYSFQNGDRVAIFAVGWQQAKDFIVFEWVSKDKNNVVFGGNVLPKKPGVFYQFCYISGESIVRGASTPFEFYATPDLIPTKAKTESGFGDSFSLMKESNRKPPTFKIDSIRLPFNNSNKDSRIIELEAQVNCLKDLLVNSIENKPACNCKQDIKELKECIIVLTNHVQKQARDIDNLQRKNSELVANFQQLNVNNDSDSLSGTIRRKLQEINNHDLNLLSGLESLPDLPF